ncbi:MAG: 3-keto-disaccharide hydrolase [Planctomycetota bacterium]
MYAKLLRATLLVGLLAISVGSARAQTPLIQASGLEKLGGFVDLLAAGNLDDWQGDTKGYQLKDGVLACDGGKVLLTKREYCDFELRFEFRLPPAGNNGIAIRAPAEGNAAFAAMEIQVLDDQHEKYKAWLKPWQHHGSIYGVVPARPAPLKPTGEWNSQKIMANNSKIQVTVNGTLIVDVDLDEIKEPYVDGKAHPGLHRKCGHIGFLGHGDRVEFRNVRIREITSQQ